MDVAMALVTLCFVVLLLSSAAISLLLICLCLAAIRPTCTNANSNTYSPAAANSESLAPTVPPPAQHKMALFPETKPTNAPKRKSAEPQRLAWREVEALTGGFDEAAVVGRGGSGNTVYRIRFDRSLAAVKVHRWSGGGERRLAAFRRELDMLCRVGRHPRFVPLLAYSDYHEEGGALVLEYMSGGTIADCLHDTTTPLTWSHWMRIVHDVALALEHPHGTAVAIVHVDLSASNVLLDDVGGARLCDLGSACEATFSAAIVPARRGAAAVMGSPGYADPFFIRTGITFKKSDVYSFGVLLLVVVTGLPAVGASDDGGECLTAWVLPRVRATGVVGLVETRLGNDYDTAEASDIIGK